MTEHESLQEEQAVWKQKVTAASNRYKIFQDEVKSVKRKHRHNVVESEIIEQFHEYCKSEIRDIVGEIEEHREKMELYIEVKHIDVGQLLEESKVLVNENENDRKLLASLRKELSDLKLGLINNKYEIDSIDVIQDGMDGGELEDSNDEIRGINSRTLSSKTGVKFEENGRNAAKVEVSARHSPTTRRSISPETDKFFKDVEKNRTDLLVTSEVSKTFDIIKKVNSYDGVNRDFKHDINTCISETTTVTRGGIDSLIDVRGRSKTKIPKPILRNSNSNIRCENTVMKRVLSNEQSIKYVRLPVKVRSVTNAIIQDTQKNENIMDNEYVETNQSVKKEVTTNTDDVKSSGTIEEIIRTDPSAVSTGRNFRVHRSPRKLSPIESQSKTDKLTLTMTKLPPIKSQDINKISTTSMENLSPIQSHQRQGLSKFSHNKDKTRPRTKTPVPNENNLAKINSIKEKNIKPINLKKGSTKQRHGKSDIQYQERELSKPRRSKIDKSPAKNTSALCKQKPFKTIQETKKMKSRIKESKANDTRSNIRHVELPQLSNKENKKDEAALKSTILPPFKPKEFSKRRCVPLKNVNISPSFPPIQSPTDTKEKKIYLEYELSTKSKPLKEMNNRHAPDTKINVTGISYRNPGNSNDVHKVEERVNVVGKANNLYERKR